jgi:hypothetical protein
VDFPKDKGKTEHINFVVITATLGEHFGRHPTEILKSEIH